MLKHFSKPLLCCLACILQLNALVISAQQAIPENADFSERIKPKTELHSLGPDLFGDKVSLYTGTLQFTTMDVSISGNSSLPVEVGRHMDVRFYNRTAGNFSDWDLAIPHLHGIFAAGGWQVSTSGAPNQRCSVDRSNYRIATPPIAYGAPSTPFDSSEYWYGNFLYTPEGGDRRMMVIAPGNSNVPADGNSYYWVTADNWAFSCLPNTANEVPGEAFLAKSPDGTTYRFDWVVTRGFGTISQPYLSCNPTCISQLGQEEVWILPTRIEDRFGNWVTYTYNAASPWQLTDILSNDGREIQITYNTSGTVDTVAAGNRSWKYAYGSTPTGYITLTGVTLPDGSSWAMNFSGLRGDTLTYSMHSDCSDPPNFNPTSTTLTMTHPSGAVGTFSLSERRHGRSYVPFSCFPDGDGGSSATYPNIIDATSIDQKTITGAGFSGVQAWKYTYGPVNSSFDKDCTSTPCPATKTVTVTNPDGGWEIHTFSNKFESAEGKEVQLDIGQGSTTLRTIKTSYQLSSSGQPYPALIGNSPCNRCDQEGEWYDPLDSRVITQDGDNYSWQASSFDVFAQPVDVKRSNSIPGQPSIEETIRYLNDPALWVVGLPQQITNVGTGEVESLNTYNSLDELTLRARFGQTLMSYTWNGAGQLAAFTDGDQNTTTLGNYYRSIPQSIVYPDATLESLVVDNFGEITSVTDQAGHTTGYQYDPVGRISQITYPYDSSVDSAQWYPKQFTYNYITTAERGLAANHWRRTMTQGSFIDTTYFDVELHPVLDDTSDGNTDISTGFNYDWRGLTTFASYPTAGTPTLQYAWTGTHATYDVQGRLTESDQDSELGTLATTTQYLSGSGTKVTDPKNNVTTTYYQALDTPSYAAAVQVSAPEGVTQNVARDVYGNPTSITQSGLYGTESDSVSKNFYYDTYHRLCRTTEPESGSTVVAYDGANNVAWSAEGQAITGTGCGQEQVAAAAQTVRAYDPMNRLHTIAPPSGTQSTTYHYDPLGHVDHALSGLTTQTYAYNSLGLLTGETLAVVGSAYTWGLGYNYDAYGHMSAIGYPAGTGSSEGIAYAPNSRGLATQVGGYASNISYYPNDAVASFTYGNGSLYSAEQNARQLTSNFTDGLGSVLSVSEDLHYDQDGNLSTVTDLVDGTRSKSFNYDGLNRLTNAQASELYGIEQYTYDALNNLRTRLTSGQSIGYNYDATNRLQSITSAGSTIDSFGYDDRGNETSKNGVTLLFDAKDQLTQVVGYDNYAYDAEGRRVEKHSAGGSTPVYYFYNHAGQLMYSYDPGAGAATNYIYLGSKLIARNVNVQLTTPGGISFGTNPTAGSTTISWGATPTATSYTLQQSADSGSSWTTVYSGSATSTTVSGLAGGGYLYQVQACGAGNCSGWTTSATLGVWPAPPAVSVPGGTINGPYTVSWTTPIGATNYTVQESLNGGAWGIIANNTSANSISRPGTTTGSYTYRVQASNSYGQSAWSATSNAVSVNTAFGIRPAPSPTYAVPAANASGNVTISWSAAAPVTGYTLQQKITGGPTWETVYSGTGTSVSITGLTNGSYNYQLEACNDTGGDSVCTTWVAAGPMVVTHPPASAPSLSVPASSSNGSYSVTWSAVATATSYPLQESVNGSGWATVQANANGSWSTSGRGNGSYSYRVQACNAGGCGPWSGTGTITVLFPPPSPSSISVPSTSTGSIPVSWAPSSTATSYGLYQSANGGAWTGVYGGSGTSDTVSEGANGNYAFRVQACNTSGCSGFTTSGAVTVLLPPTAPNTPNVTSQVTQVTNVYVNWNAIATTTYYQIEETHPQEGVLPLVNTTSTSASYLMHAEGYVKFRIRACNASGCSAWSGYGSVYVNAI